jgi:hypothetical protein
MWVIMDEVWIGEQITDHLQVVTTNSYNIIATSTFHSLLEYII